jgi:8-oxo-dGTP diphosphatase
VTLEENCVSKVVACITRSFKDGTQLLVFEHRDFPDAGVQVPAGTVQLDESVTTALLREVQEGSGLTRFIQVHKLVQYRWFCESRNEWNDRHVFHLSFSDAPDQWDHTVKSSDDDSGMVFKYVWVPLSHVPKLAEHQDDWLHLLHV